MDSEGKHKSIDLIFLIDYLEKKYLSKYKKKTLSSSSSIVPKKHDKTESKADSTLAGFMK